MYSSSVIIKMCLIVFLFIVMIFVFALQAGIEQYPLPEMDPNGFP